MPGVRPGALRWFRAPAPWAEVGGLGATTGFRAGFRDATSGFGFGLGLWTTGAVPFGVVPGRPDGEGPAGEALMMDALKASSDAPFVSSFFVLRRDEADW
ncbi:MAG: hypothetical protein INR71_04275 [Terriglobus roseus]|nr:hypothetical protein [Terriglobus roseus]